MTKEEKSLIMLKDFEPKEGYFLAFSGGKDSCVLHHLCEKAEVNFTAYFCKTSIDPPEVIKHIKQYYPGTIILKPKLTMFQLIEKNKFLPTRNRRYCCSTLKEYAGKNRVVLTGIRSEESIRRKKRNIIEYDNRHHKLLIHPIKEWFSRKIHKYIKDNNITLNPLYSEGFKRIGCVGCCMASAKQNKATFKRFPKFRVAYINSIKKLMNQGFYKHFETPDDVFDWWLSDMNFLDWKSKKIKAGRKFKIIS